MEMPNDDFDLDSRQSKCQRKFDIINDQFVDLIHVIDAAAKPPKPKRRRVNSEKGGRSSRTRGESEAAERSTSTAANSRATDATVGSSSAPETSSTQTDANAALVKLITRHLNDLNTADHLPGPSSRRY